MSKRTVIDCDCCRKESAQAQAFHLKTGYERCPSGNGGQDTIETVDLCPECTGMALREFVKGLNTYERAAAWLKRFKKGWTS